MGDAGASGGERTTALVVEAEPPLDNLLKVGKRSHGSVRILIDEGADAIYVLGGRFKRDKDHWLVPGMEIPVSIDRTRPEDFEVIWDAVPDMAELAAANDPAVARPSEARRRVREAVTAATSAIDTGGMPGELADAVGRAQRGSAEEPDDIGPLLAEASSAPAPAGKQRGVAQIATSVVELRTEGGDGRQDRTYETREGRHDAVLSVHLPGQEPYAVYVKKVKFPRKTGLARAVPALVSLSDRADVELDWERGQEAAVERVSQRIAAATDGAREAGELEQVFSKAAEDAIKRGPPPGLAGTGTPGVNPQMRAMMIQNAKMALANCPPQMRETLIQQYRMAGIEIDEQGNVVE